MKRTALMPRRRSLRHESERHKAERARRAEVRAFVLQRDGGCVATDLVPQIACVGPLDVHEVIPRSVWRAGYLEPTNCTTLCRAHHDWVGAYPVLASEVGLHGFSWERP